MKNIIKDWLKFADDDIKAANSILKDNEYGDGYINTGAVVFHCQQAIEKYFKGFLIENGWELQKTHNLNFLYNEILKIKDLSLDINFIKEIYERYERYEKVRYPGDYYPPTEEEAREYYKFALEVKSKIEQELK
ncbi:MAG: HEPN domain-containing protein [Endomicrobium sp.]|jgi:HEPN domain-containing protein|nr:HEPN domain-containing protein [Endomicrobium sp.]